MSKYWMLFLRWWNNQDAIDTAMGLLTPLLKESAIQNFLLDNGALMDAPDTRLRAAYVIAPYAYIHPKTLAKLVGGCLNYPTDPWLFIPGSPTRWVSTALMPEGRVIFSPNAMPGIPGGNYVQKVFAH